MPCKWDPLSDPVGPTEHLGRRLFDEPILKSAEGQPSFSGLNLRHFEESRDDRELSLDRLGKTGIVGKVKNYLVPRAHYSAKKSKREFNGWVVVTAKQLASGYNGQSYTVEASPIPCPTDGNQLEENKYHSHCKLPDDVETKISALFIREVFYKGKLERIADQKARINRFIDKITQTFRWLMEALSNKQLA